MRHKRSALSGNRTHWYKKLGGKSQHSRLCSGSLLNVRRGHIIDDECNLRNYDLLAFKLLSLLQFLRTVTTLLVGCCEMKQVVHRDGEPVSSRQSCVS